MRYGLMMGTSFLLEHILAIAPGAVTDDVLARARAASMGDTQHHPRARASFGSGAEAFSSVMRTMEPDQGIPQVVVI